MIPNSEDVQVSYTKWGTICTQPMQSCSLRIFFRLPGILMQCECYLDDCYIETHVQYTIHPQPLVYFLICSQLDLWVGTPWTGKADSIKLLPFKFCQLLFLAEGSSLECVASTCPVSQVFSLSLEQILSVSILYISF